MPLQDRCHYSAAPGVFPSRTEMQNARRPLAAKDLETRPPAKFSKEIMRGSSKNRSIVLDGWISNRTNQMLIG